VAALVYMTITSLDGYVADERGEFGWARPDEEVHTAANDLARPIATHLYGRRMYEVMSWWEQPDADEADEPIIREFAAMWQQADKVVYSSTLEAPHTARTRIERRFDPEAVAAMKAGSDGDLSISGPTLAAHALRAGLVDEVQLFVTPVAVGGGTPAFPIGLRLDLALVDSRTFAGGTVLLRYTA
jgi:dihydrofolate reductase